MYRWNNFSYFYNKYSFAVKCLYWKHFYNHFIYIFITNIYIYIYILHSGKLHRFVVVFWLVGLPYSFVYVWAMYVPICWRFSRYIFFFVKSWVYLLGKFEFKYFHESIINVKKKIYCESIRNHIIIIDITLKI